MSYNTKSCQSIHPRNQANNQQLGRQSAALDVAPEANLERTSSKNNRFHQRGFTKLDFRAWHIVKLVWNRKKERTNAERMSDSIVSRNACFILFSKATTDKRMRSRPVEVRRIPFEVRVRFFRRLCSGAAIWLVRPLPAGKERVVAVVAVGGRTDVRESQTHWTSHLQYIHIMIEVIQPPHSNYLCKSYSNQKTNDIWLGPSQITKRRNQGFRNIRRR